MSSRACEMLEHVPDPARATCLRAAAQAGGTAFFSTLNRNPKSFLLAIIGAEYVLRLLPRGTHEYAKFIKPSELAADLPRCGACGCRYHRHDLQPGRRVYSLGRDTDVNYILHARAA